MLKKARIEDVVAGSVKFAPACNRGEPDNAVERTAFAATKLNAGYFDLVALIWADRLKSNSFSTVACVHAGSE